MSQSPRDASPSSDASLVPFKWGARKARRWAYTIGAIVVLASVILAVVLPSEVTPLFDRVGFVCFGLAIFWFCHRQASVSITADDTHLHVRNLFGTRTCEWSEILGVSFPQGNPWAHLDVADGSTVSVMALQSIDAPESISRAQDLNREINRRSLIDPPHE